MIELYYGLGMILMCDSYFLLPNPAGGGLKLAVMRLASMPR